MPSKISWIVAPEAFTEHPNWPANYGAWYIAQVLNALTARPDVWSKTALLITYDENDGFFDHMVPAYPASTVAPGQSTVPVTLDVYPGIPSRVAGPYGLGQRVPMVVVSPWSKFGVLEPNISPWRLAVCGDLTSAFDFKNPESTIAPLPDTSGYMPPDHLRHSDYRPTVPSNTTLPAQEPGVRPARAVPYDLSVEARVEDSRLRVAFANDGESAAPLTITDAYGKTPPTTLLLKRHAFMSVTIGGAATNYWYDVTIVSADDASFVRCLAGHVESGQPSTSDPAIGAT